MPDKVYEHRVSNMFLKITFHLDGLLLNEQNVGQKPKYRTKANTIINFWLLTEEKDIL